MAISKAVGKVIDKGKKLAAHIFEAAEEDVVFEHGSFHVKGSPDKSKAFGEVAFASYGMGLPEGMEQGLEAVAYFDPPNLVWPFGAHVAVVEIDAETGTAKLEKYVAVDDCGNIINPMIVDGQIHGGVVQAIAQALYEEVVYDESSGQLKTGTMIDYLIPSIGRDPATHPRQDDHAEPDQRPGRERHRRGGHHRGQRRGDQRHLRRAEPARHQARRHARNPRQALAHDEGGA